VKISSTNLMAAAFVLAAVGVVPVHSRYALIAPPSAHAQNMGMRIVSGAVLDADSQPVVGATVFLKNQKTKSIRSYTSTEKGHFYFAQVNMTDDYDLWAEKNGLKSPSKTVSSWDSSKEVVSELKLK